MIPPTSTNTRFEPALGCQYCFAQEACGGFYHPGNLDCLTYCCNNPASCSYLCPRNNKFLAIWRDTDGLDINIKVLRQHDDQLPTYVPLVQHGSQRCGHLQVPVAAITTFSATRRDKTTRDMLRDPVALRQRYRLAPTTPIILSSIARDAKLERYWRDRHHRRIIDGIRSIAPAHVIAPNFSLFRDVPRFDNLANIKRSLLCAEELSAAGLSVIPYIAGITAHDWDRWAGFLREHSTIRMVCKEFQTGPSSNIKAAWHIARLEELQQRTGRALHLIAIGGRRHLPRLRAFPDLTVIDSVPFMRTMHRRILNAVGWSPTPTPLNAPLDDLLAHNLTAYLERIRDLRERPPTPGRPPRPTTTADPNQLGLWQSGDAAPIGASA
jgi:Domain of unknown function (DUF4417)